LEYLKLKKKPIQLNCIKILANITSQDNSIVEQVLETNNLLSTLVELLSNNSINKEITCHILYCIANIVCSGLKLMNQIVTCEKMHEALIGLLKTSSDSHIRNEVMAIYHTLTSKGDSFTLSNVLLKSVLFEAVVDQLTIMYPGNFICNLVCLLKNLVKNEITENDVGYKMRVKSLFEIKLREILCNMHNRHHNFRIQNECIEIHDFICNNILVN
jgi:hypothetical protein